MVVARSEAAWVNPMKLLQQLDWPLGKGAGKAAGAVAVVVVVVEA
jgi:hypothetical protein